jgi:hypothetical protein
MEIDTLTVVYKDELDLLKKQAEKFNLYMQTAKINNIYVILNDDTLTEASIDVDWWGNLKNKVKILHRSKLGYNPSSEIKGWYTQQVCKILGTCNAKSEWCLIYDAKTLPNKEYKEELIFDGNRGNFANWIENISHHWYSGLQFLKEKYNITDFKWISPAGVPFLAHVPSMQAMVNEETNFVQWFHSYCDFPNKFNTSTRGITEFLCYSAYVSSKPGLFEKLYTDKHFIGVYNLTDWQVDQFDIWMDEIKKVKPFTVSIHPRAYNLLTEDQRNEWNNYIK